MDEAHTDQTDPVLEPRRYEIRVQGHLAPRWADWFDGMALTAQDDGTTVIHGLVADQSELQGILRRLGEIGLTLIALSGTAPTIDPRTPPETPPQVTTPRRSTT